MCCIRIRKPHRNVDERLACNESLELQSVGKCQIMVSFPLFKNYVRSRIQDWLLDMSHEYCLVRELKFSRLFQGIGTELLDARLVRLTCLVGFLAVSNRVSG